MCSTQKQLRCQCFNTQHFTFNKTAQKVPTEVIDWESGNLIGKWCVIKYDDETALVKCMHRVGANGFFWPLRDDFLWYLFDDVLEIIQAPQPVTSHHMEIQKDVWMRLSQSHAHFSFSEHEQDFHYISYFNVSPFPVFKV